MGCSFNEEKVGHKHTQININNHEHRQMWAWKKKKKKTEILIRSHRPQRDCVVFRVEIRLLVKTVIQQHEEKKTKQIHIKVCVWEKVSHTHTHTDNLTCYWSCVFLVLGQSLQAVLQQGRLPVENTNNTQTSLVSSASVGENVTSLMSRARHSLIIN